MRKYKYILCTEKKVSKLISFIRQYWNKNHILTRNKKLFNWQYKNLTTKKINFILCINHLNKIVGILGFIPLNQFSKKITFHSAVWLSFWMSIDEKKNPGLGLGMIQFLRKKLNIQDILNIGLNNRVLPIFKYLKYETGRLQHYVILNSNCKKFHILKNYKNKKIKKKKIAYKNKGYHLQELSKKNFMFLVKKFKNRLFTFYPKKNSEYILKRYFKHPSYKYKIFILKNKKNFCCSLFIMRKIRHKNSSIFRLIDYQGNINFLEKINYALQELMHNEKSEYIDFYQHGIRNNILLKSGFINVEKTKLIVPNYFEPYVKKNITLNYAFKTLKKKKIYFFKGDGDQDRPNKI